MDPVAARRMIFNRAIVHGIFLVLLSLDDIVREANHGDVEILDLKARFRKPLAIGEVAHFRFEGEWPRFDFDVRSAQALLVSGSATFGMRSDGWGRKPLRPGEAIAVADMSDDKIEAAAGLECLTATDGLTELLPDVCRAIPTEQIAALLALTRTVGMRCPGLRSVLSEVTLNTTAPAQDDRICWAARGYDRRFSRLTLDISGSGCTMTAVSFVQPRPRPDSSVDELRDLVVPGEFSHSNALVIGGSRGLGAAFVSLLALGGSRVVATYRAGAFEARKIKAELGEAGARVRYEEFDLNLAARLPDNLVDPETSELFYCASPPIFVASKGVIAPAIFDDFNRIYVTAFLESFQQIRQLCPRLSYVFYPSSTVLDEPQPNLVEYAMSKIAAEELVRALQSKYRKIRFDCVRIPRLDTDQTMTLSDVRGLPPSTAALRVLRRGATA